MHGALLSQRWLSEHGCLTWDHVRLSTASSHAAAQSCTDSQAACNQAANGAYLQMLAQAARALGRSTGRRAGHRSLCGLSLQLALLPLMRDAHEVVEHSHRQRLQ